MCILCISTPDELYTKTFLKISECDKHTDFPFLPNVEELEIRKSSLMFFPSLPKLESFHIEDSKITSLPEFSNLRFLTLVRCYNLNEISYQPLVDNLAVSDCYNLFSIPILPQLDRLTLHDTSISTIPESMFLVVVNCPLLYVPVKKRHKHTESSLLGKRIINVSRKLQFKNFLVKNTPICKDVIVRMIIPYLLV